MSKKFKMEYRPINEIKPYKNNPRKNDDAVQYVEASLREFDFTDPVIVDGKGELIAGHTRLKAAKKLGLKELPVIVRDDLTEDQIKALRIAHNKTGEFAEWDDELLSIELPEIEMDMEQFGFSMDDYLEEEQTDIIEDEIPTEEEVETRTKRGDVWKLGRHRLMCGDTTIIEDVKKLMGPHKADMIFTDPPYNVDYSAKNKFLNEADNGDRIQRDIENDSFETDTECMDLLWGPSFRNMRAVSQDYCSIYATMPQGGAHMMMMMMSISESWKVKHELIWVKNNHVLGRADYLYKHEPILYGWAETHKFYGKGEFNKSTWEIPKPSKSDLHPTMKPVQLIVNALLNSSQKGDIILDGFGGSGTTLIACEQTQRDCRMMEFEPHYCDIIIQRWENLTGQKAERMIGEEDV